VALVSGSLPRLPKPASMHGYSRFNPWHLISHEPAVRSGSALYASKVDLHDALKQAATRVVGGGGMVRMRGMLVVAEIALAVSSLQSRSASQELCGLGKMWLGISA